jgi:hypothetical protein
VLASNAGTVGTEWWQEVDGNGLSTMPCDIHQKADTGFTNSDGSTILELGWLPGYTGGGLPALQQIHTQTIYPQNVYVEFIGRVQDTPDTPPSSQNGEDPGSYTIVWTYTSPGWEPDINENFGQSNWPAGGTECGAFPACSGSATTVTTIHRWPDGGADNPWAASFDVRPYHKWGMRFTGDAANSGNIAACIDFDGVRSTYNTNGCVTISYGGGNGTSDLRYNWQYTNGALCNSGTSVHPGGIGFGDASCVTSSRLAYRTKGIRILTCAGWNTGNNCSTGPITSNP